MKEEYACPVIIAVILYIFTISAKIFVLSTILPLKYALALIIFDWFLEGMQYFIKKMAED